MFESAVANHPKGRVAPRAGLVVPHDPGAHDELAIRLLDVTIALCVIIFALPLLVMIALSVISQDRGPAVFAHERIGLDGRMFRCFKFRSMVLDAEERLNELLERDPQARAEWARDHKLRRDPRITRVGDFLRKSSLDELPQLFNVLRGEMSIVGPRPIVAAEVVRYGRHFARYCAVKPGITGLWQVSGRNDVSYRRRVAMDCIYARRKSLAWDIKLLFLTVPAVLFASGSY
jgi:lipopolysaccharide/colanic/teichoic acid biosynthesis glycosyltransferase